MAAINEDTSKNNVYDEDAKPRISQDITDNAAAGIAGLKELAMLDNGALARLEEIEKFIFYRQFYFPGGVPVLRISGEGQSKPGFYEYDQIKGERYVLDDWDPRYIEEYITQAKQNGFHRHFLYFDGLEINTISFDNAYTKLYFALEDDHFKKEYADEAYGIIGGMLYMDKLKYFFDEYSEKFGMTAKEFEQIAKIYGKTITDRCQTQLQRLTGQSPKDFVNKNYGWYSQDMKFAFDVKQYAKEWEEKQAEYNEYKNKIWQLLQKTQNLNLCTNRTSGINIGNVNIQQSMNCAMQIENNMKAGAEIKLETEEEKAAQKAKEDEVNKQLASIKQDVKTVNTNVKTMNENVETVQQQNEQNKIEIEQVNQSNSKMKIIIIAIVCVLVVGGVVGVILFIVLRKKDKIEEKIDGSFVDVD